VTVGVSGRWGCVRLGSEGRGRCAAADADHSIAGCIVYGDPVSAHVLIAEDNELQAEAIRRYLEQAGHTVTALTARSTEDDLLRKRIETDPSRPVRLVTVFGVGYKLREPRSGNPDRGRVA
jgi:hypothetical protein